ncbi:hypothetical protein Hanom_Chr06g00578281 [Helianthus anomalus]
MNEIRLVGMESLIPMRMGRHVDVTSPSLMDDGPPPFLRVGGWGYPHNFLLFNLFICLIFIV